MVYHGRVRKGVVVLTGGTSLPEGTEVHVEPVEATNGDDAEARELAEKLDKLAGTVKDLPADLARNHNHYIHGAAKR